MAQDECIQCKPRSSMPLPPQKDLPFFAYGVFSPGALGFLRLQNHVEKIEPAKVKGEILLRDGVPTLNHKGRGLVSGFILYFSETVAGSVYQEICDLEPKNLYFWETVLTQSGTKVNILAGKKVTAGTTPCDDEWRQAADPLFQEAMPVISKMASQLKLTERTHQNMWELFFQAQMAYLLLWSVIEHYVSIRYRLDDKVLQKIKPLAKEHAFRKAYTQVVSVETKRDLVSAADPDDKFELRPNTGEDKVFEKGLLYYYQIRNNIAHRGKAGVIVDEDYQHVFNSLQELTVIFSAALDQALMECKSIERSVSF